MTRRPVLLTAALVGVLTLSACANTVRGVGRDVGNTVSATQGAVEDVASR